MKTQLLRLLFKRQLSVSSNLRPFLGKKAKNKTFWYFHESIHFKDLTFRNEKCYENSSQDIKLRKQITDSILKNSNYVLSESVLHGFPLKTKLFVLDALYVISGTDDKNTIAFFDALRPQIIFELQKQNIFVLIHILYLSSVIKTENIKDFSFLVSKIVETIEDYFLSKRWRSQSDDELCSKDIAVLCHSLFRLKIKFKSSDVPILMTNWVIEDIKNNRLNRSYVLSIVKYLRFIELNDQKVVESIKLFVENDSNVNKFSFIECAHYLAFFANLCLYDKNIYKLLADQRSDKLLDDSQLQFDIKSIRSKDLARFLWSVSSLNHKLNEKTMDCLVRHIQTLFKSDFTTFPHFLIDCLKSLIILEVFPQNLLTDCLNSKQFLHIISKSDRNKVSKDLYFILESIAIERPDIRLERRALVYSMAKELQHNVKNESKIRPKLDIYLNLINNYEKSCGLQPKAKLFYCLPHIGIASILYNGYSLEIIDPTLSVDRVSNQLNGLMATKIRQMTKKNIPYILVNNSKDLIKLLPTL